MYFNVKPILKMKASGGKPAEEGFVKKWLFAKKIFFYTVKNFPQEIENTREIIGNMSEIF